MCASQGLAGKGGGSVVAPAVVSVRLQCPMGHVSMPSFLSTHGEGGTKNE